MGVFSKIKKKPEILGGLDIGTSKVCCVIARHTEKNELPLEIIGLGEHISKGVKSAHIINLEELELSIRQAIHSAEQQASVTLKNVSVNIPSIYSTSRIVDVTIQLSEYEPIDHSHIQRLLSIKNIKDIPEDHSPIHIIPVCYTVDDQTQIKDPKGMFGKSITAHIHLILAPKSLLKALSQTIAKCHLDVAHWVVTPYASGISTLVDDEKELGVTVIDIGGGHTSFATFLDGILIYADSIAVGGQHITNDIARGLSIPLIQSERLKTLYGTLISSSSDERESIVVPQIGEDALAYTKQISKALLTQVMKARVEELLEILWKKLRQSGIDRLGAQRLVLTGGSSQLSGMRDIFSQWTGKQVRMGHPTGIDGPIDYLKNPGYATAFGLITYGIQHFDQDLVSFEEKKPSWFKKIFFGS